VISVSNDFFLFFSLSSVSKRVPVFLLLLLFATHFWSEKERRWPWTHSSRSANCRKPLSVGLQQEGPMSNQSRNNRTTEEEEEEDDRFYFFHDHTR
jgi:hypothetical protein